MGWTARAAASRVPASLPTGVRIYAVGDIHGRSDLLSRVLRSIGANCRRRPADRSITGAFATGRLTCIVIEGSGIAQMPT